MKDWLTTSLRSVGTIYRRELFAYFASPIASIFLLGFLMGTLSYFYFVYDYFATGEATMRAVFLGAIPVLFTLLVPAITMRIWAEERRQGSEELLLTLPLGDTQVLLGKFFAATTFILVALAMTFPLPLTLAMTVEPTIGVDWGPVVTGYLGDLLLGAAYIAIGCFISAMTRHQIVAFVVTVVLLLALTLPRVAIEFFYVDMGLTAQRWLRLLSISSYMADLAKGIVSLREVVFFLSAIGLFLALNHAALRARRWG